MCHVLMRHFLCDFMALRVIDPISQFIGEVVKKGVGYFQNSGGNWLKGELKNSGVVRTLDEAMPSSPYLYPSSPY